MRTTTTWLVTLTLAAGMLAGCGQAATTGAPVAANQATLAAKAVPAGTMAGNFATAVKVSFKGTVAVKGNVVTLTAPKQVAIAYDFTATPRTGLVAVSANGATTQVAYAKLMQAESSDPNSLKFLPIMLVPIAIDMAVAGAKAYAWYAITHQGSNFNQHDAIEQTVIAMAQAGVSFLPMSGLYEWLVPIAVDFIMNTKASDYENVAKAALKDIDKIVEAIKHAINHDATPAAAAAF